MSRDRFAGVYTRVLAGSYPVALWAIVLLAFGLRFYHAGSNAFTGDETPKVELADSIRLSLSDPHFVFNTGGHPLLLAYLAHFGGVIFGKSVVGYRMPLVLIGTLTCWAVYRLARELGGKSAGLWAAALIAVDQFHVTGSGSVHVHDIPLVFFGTLALLSCSRITPQAPIWPFLGLGLWMGLAYLGKETALLIWPALWLYVAQSKERRAVLRDPRWYLAHVVFLGVVAPDVIWNLAHPNEGYFREVARETTREAGALRGSALSLFIGEIVMLFDPAALGGRGYWCSPLRTMHWVAGGLYLWSVAWAWRLRQRAGVLLLLLCFTVTMLVVTLIPSPAEEPWDSYWWPAMAMSPAIALTGLVVSRSVDRSPGLGWVFLGMWAWLLFKTATTLAGIPFSLESCTF